MIKQSHCFNLRIQHDHYGTIRRKIFHYTNSEAVARKFLNYDSVFDYANHFAKIQKLVYDLVTTCVYAAPSSCLRRHDVAYNDLMSNLGIQAVHFRVADLHKGFILDVPSVFPKRVCLYSTRSQGYIMSYYWTMLSTVSLLLYEAAFNNSIITLL
jgi:hypothetical protein